jgi:DNA primase
MHNSLKEKVLEATDILDVVGERVTLTRKGKEFVGLCPFHDDHRPSFAVNPQKQIFKCWSCGAGGDVIKFVELAHRVDFRQALALLAERAGIALDASRGQSRSARVRDDLRRVMEWARKVFVSRLQADRGRAARDYVAARGISPESCDRFQLGFAPDDWTHLVQAAAKAGVPRELLIQSGLAGTGESGRVYDRFRNRLMFPIRDSAGRCVAFGGRTLGDDPAKYLNSPETPLFSKSRVLYGLDQARQAILSAGQVLVVEGFVDLVMLHQFGFRHSVATMGTAMTDAHIRLLRPLTDGIVLCFDRDDAGMRAAERAVEASVRHPVHVRVAIMGAGKDPAECLLSSGTEGFTANLNSARDALEFKWNGMVSRLGSTGPLARRSAVDEFLRFVGSSIAGGGVDPLSQGVLVSRLSELVSLPAGQIYDLLARAASGKRPATRLAPDTSDSSAYAVCTGGLPAGLVTAIEELFGLVLCVPSALSGARESLSCAADLCAPWGRLLEVTERAAGLGVLSRERVIDDCEDAELCELVARACARVPEETADVSALDALVGRVNQELHVVAMDGLRASLRGGTAASREAFETLVQMGKSQQGVLPAARWQVPQSAAGGAGVRR